MIAERVGSAATAAAMEGRRFVQSWPFLVWSVTSRLRLWGWMRQPSNFIS
jgi:hypothetical protein